MNCDNNDILELKHLWTQKLRGWFNGGNKEQLSELLGHLGSLYIEILIIWVVIHQQLTYFVEKWQIYNTVTCKERLFFSVFGF